VIIVGQTEWCYPGGTVNNGQQQCPPANYACARSTADMIQVGDPLPPPCKLVILVYLYSNYVYCFDSV